MKKRFTALLLSALFILSFASCGKNDPAEELSIPAYPLTAQYMQDYLNGLTEGYEVHDNSFPNEYDDFEGITLGIAPSDTPQFEQVGITSTAYKGERSLAFTIVSGSTSSGKYTSAGEKFDIDSSENVIKLATKLFGGFSSEDAVYKKLKKELGRKNTTQTTHDGEVYVIHKWKCDIDGISCEIKFTQPDKDKDEMHLYTIMFMTDPELYEQRNLQRIKDLNINVN